MNTELQQLANFCTLTLKRWGRGDGEEYGDPNITLIAFFIGHNVYERNLTYIRRPTPGNI